MKTVAAIPESITKEAYVALVAGAGFEPNVIRRLEFRMNGIYAEVYEPGPDGRSKAIHRDADEPVINRVWIPVRD